MSDEIQPTAPDASEEPTPAQIEELQAQAAKAAEHWDRVLRLSAEFDNFKKRAARERDDAVKYANQSLLGRLLPVLDNFEMALTAAESAPAADTESLRTGVGMILTQLRSVLLEAGAEEIDATGKMFDPTVHEAVSQQETTEVPEGQVVHQLRKGYKFRERLLRPASVVVAKKPPGKA